MDKRIIKLLNYRVATVLRSRLTHDLGLEHKQANELIKEITNLIEGILE